MKVTYEMARRLTYKFSKGKEKRDKRKFKRDIKLINFKIKKKAKKGGSSVELEFGHRESTHKDKIKSYFESAGFTVCIGSMYLTENNYIMLFWEEKADKVARGD